MQNNLKNTPPFPVAIIGVGNMGGAIATHLLAQDWPVAVYDVDADKVEKLTRFGAVARVDCAQAAINCVALIVCVVDAAQTEAVLFGATGAAQALAAGATVILCPTIAPQDVERIAARLALQGIHTIDAPMSGGPARALDGSMSLMVACADSVFEANRVLIEAMSRKVFRIGQRVGDGARTKLVNNLLAGINLVGTAEAMAMAQAMGLNLHTTLDVIEHSSGQSWIGSDRMHRALQGDFAPRAHVTLLEKDTQLAVDAAHAVGFAGPLGASASAVFAQAHAAGLALEDDAAVLKVVGNGSTLPKLPTREALLQRIAQCESDLANSEHRFEVTFLISPEAISITRLSDGMYLEVNEGWTKLSKRTRSEVIGKTSIELAIWRYAADRERLTQCLVAQGEVSNFEFDFQDKHGNVINGLMSARYVEYHGVPCVLAVTRDISQRKQAEQQVRDLAYTDALTALPNRRGLHDRLNLALAAGRRSGRFCALLFLDLNDFKSVNDRWGHAVGDLLLIEVARRLMACVRATDTVVRLGGDEFVVLLSELQPDFETSKILAHWLARKIAATFDPVFSLCDPLTVPPKTVVHQCGTSVGGVVFSGQMGSAANAIRIADQAMYQAKKGRGIVFMDMAVAPIEHSAQ